MNTLLLKIAVFTAVLSNAGASVAPLVSSELVFEERGGLVAVEGEHFFTAPFAVPAHDAEAPAPTFKEAGDVPQR